MRVTAYAFDVFDTCLARAYAHPTDVFGQLAQELKHLSPAKLAHVSADALWSARIEAERRARESSPYEEVTLDEIWQEFALMIGVPELMEHLPLELQIESNTIIPIESTREQVDSLRKAGNRIIFISDMYLPADFIIAELLRHRFAHPNDGIYVSSTVRKTKQSGNLFRHVLEAEKLLPQQIHYTGDNPNSDYSVPKAIGIHCSLSQPSKLTNLEQRLLTAVGDDYLPRSQVIGSSKAFRVSRKSDESATGINQLAEILGLVLLAFCSWVLDQASRDGVGRLYFLSRDCQLAFHIARVITTNFQGINCRYLYVSRQALYLPSAHSISSEGMPWMRRNYEDGNLGKLLAKLEIPQADAEEIAFRLGGKPARSVQISSTRDWDDFWQLLNQEPYKSKIMFAIEARRKAATAYFMNNGLMDAQISAVVDLGWTLHGQRALNSILHCAGYEGSIQGYYLGLQHQRLGPNEAGKASALFTPHPPGITQPQVFQHVTILEHILGIADHPSVLGYEMSDRSSTVLFQSRLPAESSIATQLQTTLADYARSATKTVATLSRAEIARTTIDLSLKELIQNPPQSVVRLLSNIMISTDQNNLGSEELVHPLSLAETFRLILPGRLNSFLRLRPISRPWMAAAIRSSHPWLRQLINIRHPGL
jgi:FMN phosphatase YigB (HAD superfamily)